MTAAGSVSSTGPTGLWEGRNRAGTNASAVKATAHQNVCPNAVARPAFPTRRVSCSLVLEDHREHGGAERGAQLLDAADGARGARICPVGQVVVHGSHRRHEDRAQAGTPDGKPYAQHRLARVWADLRIGDRPERGQRHADEHERPRTDPVGEPPDDRQGDHHAEPLRCEQQPCIERAQAARLLVIERQQQHRTEDREPGEQDHAGGRRERARPEEAQVDDRLDPGAQRVDANATSSAVPEHERHEHARASEATACTGLREAVDDRRQRRRQQGETEHVERVLASLGGDVHEAPREYEGQRADRHVDEEDPAPAEALSRIRPPITGPMTGASSAGTAIAAASRPRRCGPAAWARIVESSGKSRPPPRPCTTRNAIRLPADHATPHRTEPPRNSSSDSIHMGFAPKRSTDQPASGMTMASASR